MAVPYGRLKQRGVALITAMLVVVVATVAAAAMASRQQLDIRRTANVLNADQAWAYVEGVEDWSKVILIRDQKDNQIDHPGEIWASQLAPIAVDGGQIIGRLTDQQGLFNLNNLFNGTSVSNPDVAVLRRLMELLGLDPDSLNALLDWMDADQDARFPGGAEDNDYLLLNPAYRAANRSLTSVTELAAIKGFDAAAVSRLTPFVTVLPERTPINVNTAPAEVLQALHADLSQADVQTLITVRGENGFASVNDFLAQPALAGREIPVELAVASGYFLLDAQVDIGLARSQAFMLLRRDDGKVTTLWRSRGVW